MASTPDDDRPEPSLELPSLRLPLRRRGKPAQQERAEPERTQRRVAVTAEPERTEPGWAAVAVTGGFVGLGGAGATYAALTACEAVRGVSTCGGAPGFLVLVAIVGLMVLAGAALLRLSGAAAAGSTSLLAVGVVTVAVMLFLLEVIHSPWMFLVVPAVAAASFLLGHWVSTRFGQEDTGRRDWT